jgi:hypothetical protein
MELLEVRFYLLKEYAVAILLIAAALILCRKEFD